MSKEKLYRVRTKGGAHISEKDKDGWSTAIQFDNDNKLKGPVQIKEVKGSEYQKTINREKRKSQTSNTVIEKKQNPIVDDFLIPVAIDFLTQLAQIAIDEGVELTKNRIIPALKRKAKKITPIVKSRAKEIKNKFKKHKAEEIIIDEKANVEIVENNNEQKLHTQEEVDQIIKNMKLAALYIAAGIKELSNTVVSDIDDSEKKIEVEKKLKELSSEDIRRIIDFMLEDKNKYLLDKETLKLFKAFRHDELIVNGELVPIKKYIELDRINDFV